MNSDGMHGDERDKHNHHLWSYFREHAVDYQRELLYDSRGPWPTPSPGRPLSEVAEVINLPKEENWDWYRTVVWKYLRDLVLKFIPGLWWAYIKSGGRYIDFDDETLNRHITHGMYSKFLTDLDDGDTELFAGAVPDLITNPQDYKKMDFSGMENICNHTYPGTYAAATVGLFKRLNREPLETYAIAAIHIYTVDRDGDKEAKTADTLTPGDGERWGLAKYFLLQGAVLRINMTEHGRLHFPYDSINAITKSVFPTTHPLFRLLIPHFRLTLPINASVLEGGQSVVNRYNWVIYSPFTAEGIYIRKLIPDGYVGRKSKPNGFPPFKFPLDPKYLNTSFGVCLTAYYEVFHHFVKQVLDLTLADEYRLDDTSGARREWEFIALWASSIAEWIPGFPIRQQLLLKGDNDSHVRPNKALLAKVVTTIMWNLSVAHAADHIGFGYAGPQRNVFRLHVPPPLKGVSVDSGFQDKLVKPWDLFQSYLTHELFYKPRNIVKLVDVEYDFSGHPNEIRLREATEEFIQALKACDREQRGRDADLFPLADVSTSIQY